MRRGRFFLSIRRFDRRESRRRFFRNGRWKCRKKRRRTRMTIIAIQSQNRRRMQRRRLRGGIEDLIEHIRSIQSILTFLNITRLEFSFRVNCRMKSKRIRLRGMGRKQQRRLRRGGDGGIQDNSFAWEERTRAQRMVDVVMKEQVQVLEQKDDDTDDDERLRILWSRAL